MSTERAWRLWERGTGRFALAAVVLVASGVVAVAVTRGEGICRKGPDPRPSEAPPAPRHGPTEDAGIWTVNVDGSDARQVAGFSGHVEPFVTGAALHWLDNGTRFVHTQGRPDGKSVLVATGMDGAPLGEVAAPTGQDHAWSHDGRIAFVDQGLVTAGPDGSGTRRLTTFDNGGSSTVSRPEWSPDGARIVFSADSMPRSSLERLELINADGTQRQVVVERDGPRFLQASWSRDGAEIAFAALGGYYGSWIGIVRPDGSNYRRIARHCSGQEPEWSPDGSQIAFHDSYSIIVIDADGSDMMRIPDTWYGYSPQWSPDGKRIAFLRY